MAKHSIQTASWGLALARRLCTAAPAAEGARESRPLYRRLSALGGAPEGSVTRTLNKWVREGKTVKVLDLIKYVKDLRKYRRYKHALELMDWMVKTRGMNLSFSNHAIRLDLISKVKGIDSAESYFASLPEPAKKEQTYGALLNCYCQDKKLDKAIALYDKMEELNLASSTLVHNNLMALYMKVGHPEKVPIQFEEMKAKNIAADTLTYCLLMNSYSSLNDIDSVEKVAQEMQEGDEVTLNWSAYSTLAAIYSSVSLFKKAESALKQLEELIDRHDREPFHFLLSLYATTGNLAEVNRVWNLLKSTFPKNTNMSYLTMLQALNKLDDVNGMRHCYEEWESVYVTYDVRLTNLMIGAYLRHDMVQEAETLRVKATEKGAGSDFKTSELFMDHHLKKHEMNLALKCLEDLISMVKDSEWKLDSKKVNLFLKYFKEARDVNRAERFCKVLKKLNCLDEAAYESLLYTYLAAGRTEPSLWQRIKEDKIEVNLKTRKLLRSVCTSR